MSHIWWREMGWTHQNHLLHWYVSRIYNHITQAKNTELWAGTCWFSCQPDVCWPCLSQLNACVEERKWLTSVKTMPVVGCSLSFPSEAAHPFREAGGSCWCVLRADLERAQAVWGAVVLSSLRSQRKVPARADRDRDHGPAPAARGFAGQGRAARAALGLRAAGRSPALRGRHGTAQARRAVTARGSGAVCQGMSAGSRLSSPLRDSVRSWGRLVTLHHTCRVIPSSASLHAHRHPVLHESFRSRGTFLRPGSTEKLTSAEFRKVVSCAGGQGRD